MEFIPVVTVESTPELCPLKVDKKIGKVNYCTFGGTGIHSKMSRHLLEVYKDNPEILKISIMPPQSQERRAALRLLLNSGNFKTKWQKCRPTASRQ